MIPEKIEKALAEYRDALQRAVRRDVDAATCGTRRDWDAAEKAEDAANDAERALRATITESLAPAVVAAGSSIRPLIVYTIVTRERDGKKLWIRIGSASRDRDGQINVILDAVPTNGMLAIREPRPTEGT